MPSILTLHLKMAADSSRPSLKGCIMSTKYLFLCFQFLKDGYAAHLTALTTQTISRPAVGNSRLILRRGCFGLPSRVSKTRHRLKRSISDKPSFESDKDCSTISGSFNYSSFRQTKGRSVSKFNEQ